MKRQNDRTGSGSTAIVETIVNLDLGWIYRPQDKIGTDYGIDAHFEVADDEGVETGRQLGVQIKGGARCFREASTEGFVFRPSDRHVQYWRDYALPVIVVLVNTKTRVAYWAFTDRIERSTADGWRLFVPRTQTLTVDAKPVLAEAAVGGGTARTRARIEERLVAEHLRQRVAQLEEMIEAYVAQFATTSQQSAPATPSARPDILKLSFEELIAWVDAATFEETTIAPEHRTTYTSAAEHHFFREAIEEHDAAKAVTLLLLAAEWEKAASILLYCVEAARKMKRLESPSIIDFLAGSRLPTGIPLDVRIVVRMMQIAARRKHRRPIDALLTELDALIESATPREGFAVTAAAFWEARATGRSAPARAVRYLRSAAILRPTASGFDGGPFPPVLDEIWPLILELTASGVESQEHLTAWLDALDVAPAGARETFLRDEMNVVTLANRFWLDESARPTGERSWTRIHAVLQSIETWSTARSAALLFAAARRGRIVVRGEYEDDLRGAMAFATDIPAFVQNDAHASFLLKEIAASQYLYAGSYFEAVISFRDALAKRPGESSVLPTALLKAAQAAAAANNYKEAVSWAEEAVAATRTNPHRASTDIAVAKAEHALSLWFAGSPEAALDLWDDAVEELFAREDKTARWRGLVVRFHWAGGYLANTYRTGTPPGTDAEGRPYGEPRPGAFLIDLTLQAAIFSAKISFGVLLGLAAVSDKRGCDARARRWSYAALDCAAEHIPEWRQMVALFALPHFITDRRFAEAIKLGQEMARGSEAEGNPHNADQRIIAMSFSIVPALLAVGRLSAEARRAAAEELACAVAVPAETDPMWAACREIVETTFLSEGTHEDRLTALLKIRSTPAAGVPESPISMMSDLAASLLPGTRLLDALALQARAEPQLTPRLSVFPTMFRLHVVPFFREWWQARSVADPLAFEAPEDLTTSLRSIGHDAAAPKIILRTVARHIRFS